MPNTLYFSAAFTWGIRVATPRIQTVYNAAPKKSTHFEGEPFIQAPFAQTHVIVAAACAEYPKDTARGARRSEPLDEKQPVLRNL